MENKMVIQQPQPVMEVQNLNEWGSGICDCFQDLSSCCFAFWCCPCFACKTTREFDEGLCLPLLEIFGQCISPITLSMRSSMRQRYKIEGTIARDCLFTSCCTACVWCQMYREIQRRKLEVVLVNTKVV
ncbi:cornifelin homolog B-like [Anableps anableps]